MDSRFSFEAGGRTITASVDEADVPDYVLPDPLLHASGGPVAGPGDWPSRRAELLRLFRDHIYGESPHAVAPLVIETLREGAALGGAAERIRIRFDAAGREPSPAEQDGPNELDLPAELLLYLPARKSSRPLPVFLGLNFFGNHTISNDLGVPISPAWMPPAPDRGISHHRATEASRGTASSRWPIQEITSRGFALATAYCGDFDPDFDDAFANGLHGALDGPGPRGAAAWGSVGAWAFGLSRCLDVLASLPEIDATRVAVIGHSRLGKAALWAGAQDERFALVISNDSGCGGAALSRRRFGETVAAITALFPHWFCERFRDYADREAELPVDQHQLLSLIAPRPLYVASAEDDLWADPRGEALAAEAAAPVYELLGAPGPMTHLRKGGHDLTPWDWERFLDFATERLGLSQPV